MIFCNFKSLTTKETDESICGETLTGLRSKSIERDQKNHYKEEHKSHTQNILICHLSFPLHLFDMIRLFISKRRLFKFHECLQSIEEN